MTTPWHGPRSRLLTTWRIARDPFGFYPQWRAVYGDTFRLRAMNGDVVASCDPAFAQDFFRLSDDEHVPFGAEASAPLVGRGSLLLLSGDRHRRERKLLMPPFHGERMRAYADTIQRVTAARCKTWSGELRIADEMKQISLEVIIRAIFGATDATRVAQYHAAVRAQLDRLNPIFLFIPALQRSFFGLSPWNRFLEARATLRGMLREDIAAARGARGGGEDILSLLVASTYEDGAPMADDDIVDELVTLLFAGHETTQTALSWAIYWLHRHPGQLLRLRGDLDALGGAPEAIARAPFLDGVVHETLRLHPILPEVIRTLTVNKKIGGHRYPAGTHLAVVTALLHQREDLYPQPEAFRPERWEDARPNPATFTPFGGGVRRCIGAALATYEIKLVLDHVIRHVDLSVIGDEQPARIGVTMGPRHGVRVRVHGPRAAA